MTVHRSSQPKTNQVGYSGSDSVVYDDMQVNVGRVRLGATAPTWRLYDHGTGDGIDYDVLGFAVNDYIFFDVQTSHSTKLNSSLDCHMHFILPNTTNIGDKAQFQLDVIGAPIDGTYDTLASSPFTAEHTVAANDNTNHRILDLADLNTINTTVSTIFTCKLTRIAATANEYGSEVYLKYIDCHYQKDTIGSLSEDTKI